jgi:Dyp-type peroxidase family
MENIETKDIQGIILKGYSNLPAADFLLLGIKDPKAVKNWLKNNISEITTGIEKPMERAMNLAITMDGLKQLGLDATTLNSFPMEMEDGMLTRHKQDYLGDYGNSDPANWEWGGKKTEPIHILLMLYGANETIMNAYYSKQKKQLEENGFYAIKKLDTTVLPLRKEHFGFQDGIAQPTIKGLGRSDNPENTVAAGEFILGYKNEYDQYPMGPVMNPAIDKENILSPSPVQPALKDLGKNGSYIVFRQYQQDVVKFWRYMDESTRLENEKCNEHEMIKMASKMVGRWPSGSPVTLCPEKDNSTKSDTDSFGYRHSDSEGLKCPFASHIRRTNPRDAQDMSAKSSVGIANKHRILRRGRSYGTPVASTMDPEDILKVSHAEGERGLHFICFNADIGRQFEFIQNAWVNNPKFEGLYDERDPITGNHSHPSNSKKTGTFSVPQHEGLRNRYTDVPEFVNVKGGAYFFMPGIKAIKFLSTI